MHVSNTRLATNRLSRRGLQPRSSQPSRQPLSTAAASHMTWLGLPAAQRTLGLCGQPVGVGLTHEEGVSMSLSALTIEPFLHTTSMTEFTVETENSGPLGQ